MSLAAPEQMTWVMVRLCALLRTAPDLQGVIGLPDVGPMEVKKLTPLFLIDFHAFLRGSFPHISRTN